MQKSTIVGVFLLIVIIFGGICIVKYDSIVSKDEEVITAWKPLEGVLKNRYDSVQSLAKTATIYIGHAIPEDDALEQAAEEFMKAKTSEDKANAASQIEDALEKTLQKVMEKYPGISSNYQYTSAVKNIRDTDLPFHEKLPKYTKAAENYNIYIREFPNNIVAMLFGFAHKYAYLEPEK